MWNGINQSTEWRKNSRLVFHQFSKKQYAILIIGTVGRPMPGVVIRIAKESTTSPAGYETLVEADSDNTKVETQSKILLQSQ